MPVLGQRLWNATCRGGGILLLVLATSGAAEPQTRLARETDLKAVFLFNFAHFIQWPPDTIPDGPAPFVIGILGQTPFGQVLDQVVANEFVGKHRLVVRRFRDVHEVTADCHILYVSPSESPQLEHIFDAMKGKSILTVGDTEGFAEHGGMVQFMVMGNKLRVRINVAAAQAAHLTISSQLLRQAEIVEPGPGK